MNIYEYMHKLPMEGDNQQVDALTVTATGLTGKIAIGLILSEIESHLENYKSKPFYFNGAKGWQKGSVRYAEKTDEAQGRLWVILMITGEHSQQAFKTASGLDGIKFTRCDLAVDVFLYEKVLGLPRMVKDHYKGSQRLVLYESTRGDTVYVGSRESDAYLRIYDKSEEYGLDQGRVYRWEVEYKGSAAPVVVEEVRDGGLAKIRELVFSEARQKDVPTPIIEGCRGIKRARASVSSPEAKIAWLEKQVAPTIRWLTALGLEENVRNALQLPLIKFDKI